MTSKEALAARLDHFEEVVTHMDETLRDLNDMTLQQWAEIDKLKAENKKLKDRLSEGEQGEPYDVTKEPPPPHY